MKNPKESTTVGQIREVLDTMRSNHSTMIVCAPSHKPMIVCAPSHERINSIIRKMHVEYKIETEPLEEYGRGFFECRKEDKENERVDDNCRK